MIKAGIDIGYNAVKTMGNGGGATTFPSVVGKPERVGFSINGNGKDDIVITVSDGKQWIIGEGAVTQSRLAVRREDRNWINSDIYHRLMLAAFTELASGSVELKVVTGLPVSFYGDKDGLQKAFLGEHRVTRDGRRLQRFKVVECRVIPQPFGALLAASLNDQGKIINNSLATGSVAIIDIGGKTTNLLSVKRLSEVAKETASVNTGMWDAVRMMREYLANQCPDLDLHDHEIVKAITNKQVKYYGEPVDLSTEVDAILEPLADQVIAQAGQLWNSGARLDAMLIAGGGALLLSPYIKRHFRLARTVDNPVFANVTGYWRFAQRMK